MPFTDRRDAGRRLAAAAGHLRGPDTVVLGLPRGGVPVAFEVATAIAAPLDVVVVRKIGAPFQPELAMGAIGEDGVRVVDRRVMDMAGAGQDEFAAVEERERAELERRVRRFRTGRPRLPLRGRAAVIVDDGIATGSTARAACQVVRAQGARRVVVAAPVGAPDAVERLRGEADEVVCPETPREFSAIGQWYADFAQTSEDEVADLLDRAAAPGVDEDVETAAGPVRLAGRLTVPERALGVVLFAHGSGSGRHSPRNRAVAAALNRAGMGTLLFDLLTGEEEADRDNVFDVDLLAGRLGEATRDLRGRAEAAELPVGYFGASTGAAAALAAAAEPGNPVAAVVSRGGRPDLAGDRLEAVRAATLLIVGGADPGVLELNGRAQARMRCENRLTVVPGATHLFEEPGALETVAELARAWFADHLAVAP
ncbi:phosphoribosyltransferase family protein [Actinorugispora endophytica]|uniref:Putative phosphoribosyl transferase n=1 Tax=Actinorugispora endophytica TaxID=1605990 RepID=A0A4R6V2H6_9ACTN|nr:phosphoribosyltransferase family protein [Actinorugispora endophytica]TDQ50304.1 putative phosphoribosyl transferase [Actinorugispora endophytica]